MEIKNPEYILTIADEGSLTRAAEKLYVTQSALSQYLLKIENDLGVTLFHRRKGRWIPTEAGEVYLRGAEAVYHAQAATEEELAALRGCETLHLAVSAWGSELMIHILPRLKERFPGITLDLVEQTYDEMRPMMREGRVDLAISALTDDDDPPGQGYTSLYQERAVLILPPDHPYCAAHPEDGSITWREIGRALRNTGFLFSDRGSTIRKMEERLFQTILFRPQVVCELDRKDYMCRMVSIGVGAALVPASAAGEGGDVRIFDLDPPMVRRELLIARRDLQRTPAHTCLEHLICEEAAKRTGQC